MQRQGAWIDVYPIEGRSIGILPTGKKVPMNRELSDFVDAYVAEKGITFNSWIPSTDSIIFQDTHVGVRANYMDFKQVKGVTESLVRGKSFAPQNGYNPCLSVGFITSTSDGKIILQRRPEGVHCEKAFIQEPCGYMSSGYISPRPENTVDEKLLTHPGLYGLNMQLERRRKEIAGTFNMPVEKVSYDPQQDFMGAGHRTFEMYFSTVGRIDASQDELMKNRNEMIKEMEMKGNQKGAEAARAAEPYFVPFEELENLVLAQGKLSSVATTGYTPKNHSDLPLLDETTSGLIFGYKKMTGQDLNIMETVERLGRDGLAITIYNTSPGMGYKFPNKL